MRASALSTETSGQGDLTCLIPTFCEIKNDLLMDLRCIHSLSFFHLPVTVRGIGDKEIKIFSLF